MVSLLRGTAAATGPTSNFAAQTMFAAGMAITIRDYWRSSFLRELGDDVLDSLVDHAADMPRPGTLLLIEHMGGEISGIGERETAVANRGAEHTLSVLSSWLAPESDEQYTAWTRQFGDKLNSLSGGGAYVNYMANSDSPAAVRAAYEANFERLVEAKRMYETGDFFNSHEIIRR